MGKACAWCGTDLRAMGGPQISMTSHALCQSCLEELQTALSSKGLRPGSGARGTRGAH